MRRFGLLLAFLAICSLVIVACGGDDDDADDGAASATPTATEAPEVAAPDPTDTAEPEPTEVDTEASPTPSSTPTLESTEPPDEPPSPESALVIPPERDASIPRDGRVLGDPDAPVSIVEYGDFQ